MTNPTFRLHGTQHTFTPLGGPLDQQPLSPLFEEIGHAVMACGRLEYVVTALAIHINKESASALLHDPDPKDKFSGLVRLVRKWLTNHQAYAQLKDAKDDVFYTALIQSADLRNELVHGFLESIDPITGKFVVRRLKRAGRDEWTPITTTYEGETARFIGRQATLAARHFVEIAKQIFGHEDGDSSVSL